MPVAASKPTVGYETPPVIATTLRDMRLPHRDTGQQIRSAGVLDDPADWFLPSAVPAMATRGLPVGVVALTTLFPVRVMSVPAVIGSPPVRTALRRADRAESAVPPVAAAVALVLFGSAAVRPRGLEAFSRAFICGAVIPASGVVDPAKPEPLRTLGLAVHAPVSFNRHRPAQGPHHPSPADRPGHACRGTGGGRRQRDRRVRRRPPQPGQPEAGAGPRRRCGRARCHRDDRGYARPSTRRPEHLDEHTRRRGCPRDVPEGAAQCAVRDGPRRGDCRSPARNGHPDSRPRWGPGPRTGCGSDLLTAR
uniref:Asl9 n=1 Tax=Streptomyces sp. XZQH4 TaxID=1245513 RepID=A0A0P0C594_9ACTN|nr:Asl9 [Streptomyces sp. XZQH4]